MEVIRKFISMQSQARKSMDDREKSVENGDESPGKQTQGTTVEDYEDKEAEKLLKEHVFNYHQAVRQFNP